MTCCVFNLILYPAAKNQHNMIAHLTFFFFPVLQGTKCSAIRLIVFRNKKLHWPVLDILTTNTIIS